MTSFVSTYSLNLDNLKLKVKDVCGCEDWSELLCENEGSFTKDYQFMVFDCDGVEVAVNFQLTVDGSVSHDDGDYWTAPYTETEIDGCTITIEDVQIDEWDVQLNKETLKFLERVIKNNIN